MSKRHYYALESRFSNVSSVYAFDTRAARDEWVANMETDCRQALTREEARHELTYQLDPGTLDGRVGVNVYVKTAYSYVDRDRREDCFYRMAYISPADSFSADIVAL